MYEEKYRENPHWCLGVKGKMAENNMDVHLPPNTE